MQYVYHDLILEYGDTLSRCSTSLPLLLVVGRKPNNPHPFRSTIGKYPLEAQQHSSGRKRTVPFWDQSYCTIAKTAGMDCPSLKSIARSVNASPIVFTDVMPIRAAYAAGSDAPHKAREEADEKAILEHHENIFAMSEVMGLVSVVVLAVHKHGNFRKRERLMLDYDTTSFARKIYDTKTVNCLD